MVARFLKMMPSRIDEYETLLTENRIWMAGRRRRRHHAKDAVAYSMTGPTLRAAGLAYDNRKYFHIRVTKSLISTFQRAPMPIALRDTCFASPKCAKA